MFAACPFGRGERVCRGCGASGGAPKAPTDEEVVSLQNFVVTGSNIHRLDMEKVVPVTVLNQDAIVARNALTPVDLLTSLPQVINLPENETRTGSSGARWDRRARKRRRNRCRH